MSREPHLPCRRRNFEGSCSPTGEECAVLPRAGPKGTSLCHYNIDKKVASYCNFELRLSEVVWTRMPLEVRCLSIHPLNSGFPNSASRRTSWCEEDLARSRKQRQGSFLIIQGGDSGTLWIERWGGGRASDPISLSRVMPSGDFLTFLYDRE